MERIDLEPRGIEESLVSLCFIAPELFTELKALNYAQLLQLYLKLYPIRHHTPRIKIEELWQLQALVGKLDLNNLNQYRLCKDRYGANIAHYAAWSANIGFLKQIESNFPELLRSKNNFGYNIAHYAALAGDQQTLEWIKFKYEPLMQQEANNNVNIAHYIALSGKTKALNWVDLNMPGLLEKKTFNDQTIAHYAALSGSLEALAWVRAKKAHLFSQKNNVGAMSIHYAAWSGSLEALQWFLENTYNLDEITNNRQNIAHYAALSGSKKALEWVLANTPKSVDETNRHGINIAHYAAWSGSAEAMLWVEKHRPCLWNIETNYGLKPVHYAALSGNPNALNMAIKLSNTPYEFYVPTNIAELNKVIGTLDKALDDNFTLRQVKLSDNNICPNTRGRILYKLLRNRQIQEGRDAFLAFAAGFYQEDSIVNRLPIEVLKVIYESYLPQGLPQRYVKNSFDKIMYKLSPEGKLQIKIDSIKALLTNISSSNKVLFCFKTNLEEKFQYPVTIKDLQKFVSDFYTKNTREINSQNQLLKFFECTPKTRVLFDRISAILGAELLDLPQKSTSNNKNVI